MIREQPCYRRDAFMAGLKAAGYETRSGAPRDAKPGDVLVIWNRYADTHQLATQFEEKGGTVLVSENAYVGSRFDGGDYYAIARYAHNGRGEWPVGGWERLQALGQHIKPWRTDGSHVLVAANRGFGQPGGIMPYDWPRKVEQRLKALTRREIRVRLHPGNDKPKVPLAKDLENAWCVVVWTSSVGVRALFEGIPVFCEAPWWICKGAASETVEQIESPVMNYASRMESLRAMSFAQWKVDEIAAGVPFRHLLQTEAIAA